MTRDEHTPPGAPARHLDADLSTIIDRLPVGVGVVDAAGRILSLNPEGLRLHGFASQEEMLVELEAYREAFELCDLDGRSLPPEQWPIARAFRGEDVHEYEVRLRRTGHPEHVLSYSAVPAPPGPDETARMVLVIQDITDRKRTADELRNAHALIESITRGSEDLIAAEDAQFRYLFFNDAYAREFERVWGTQIEVGTSMLEVMAPWPDQQGKARQLWARALAGESFRVQTGFGPTPEQRRVYDMRFNPLVDAHGRTIGAAHILRDVTDQVRMQEALQQSQERLQESDRRKDEYLAMLGHELRNPLAAVRTAAELVRLTAGEEPRLQRACGVLERQTHHMARLIDGLLEVSRIARGKIALERQSLDLRAVLEAVLEDRDEDFERRGLDLDKALPTSPVWLSGDYVRLTQVFDNLLGNALKFTPAPGLVTVQAYEAGDVAVVRIRDSGIGLESQVLSRIFEPFHQETQDLARAGGGLGLGLALAKGLVELHGGEIEAHSEGPGRGTVLEVRLPLRPAAEHADAHLDEGESTGGGSARRILIVEDNVDTGQMLRELLRTHGHEVSVVENAPAALAVLAENGVDVVLCDIGLPGMDGYELARRIRADDDLRDLCLVAVTGYGQPEDREQARAAGFDEHLIKPVDLESLQRVLDRF